jgi:porin
MFFRYAYSPSAMYRYKQFWSMGPVYTGLIPPRDRDVLGFGFAQLVDSGAYRRWRDPNSGNETIYELYYAVEVTPWLVVTPDFKYMAKPAGNDAYRHAYPGGNDSISHAIAGGVKIRVTF